ncbi:glycosyltransferase [Laribacter hongkongensis]|uniref:glycosyltransferase n=1 Tax=Laribacter hongkongensis TaxID=168471 RepID=UPI001EFD94A4|nr:glycosyltransferase [Laribacter hongkongensis]MCG9118632.1 glycosyltransferase [Laribacter hongkongensis]
MKPLASIILVSYNQEKFIIDALKSATSQTYKNLEIIASDDASTDRTYELISSFKSQYNGPHKLIINQNTSNLGVGGNYAKATSLTRGELIFVAGGDDISLPHRVETVMNFWLSKEKKYHLIACDLIDMDENGNDLGITKVSNLYLYKSSSDWIKSPPHVIGAAHAWTRELYDMFNGFPQGIIGEDLIISFRAILTNSATHLPLPLVRYRRGGLSTPKKALSPQQVIHGLVKKTKSSHLEWLTMMNDAEKLHAPPETISYLESKMQRESFIETVFIKKKPWSALLTHRKLHTSFKLRILTYHLAPWLAWPLFQLKILKYRLKNALPKKN